MQSPDLWILLVCTLFFTLGAVTVLTGRRLLAALSRSVHRPRRQKTLEMPCSVCRKPLIIHRQELRPLSGEEVGLVVRVRPKVVGRKLAEYVCPYCDAAQVFAMDTTPPQWIGANFMEPQEKSTHCFECKKPLRTPPWSEHAFDGRIAEAPELPRDLGLVCSRCKSVCCVGCCESATRGRTADGSYLCPRCFRGPVDVVFHP